MTEITSFFAETNFKPNSIKLSWTLSGSLQVNEHLVIRRALTTYPKTPDDGSSVFDSTSSSQVTLEDNDVTDNTYYYYSIFVKNVSSDAFTDLTGKVQAFALAYKAWGISTALYNLFPEETRSLDEQTGGDLKRLSDVMGNMFDYYRSLVFVMEYNRLPEKAPDNVLDFFSESFGFPAERSVDLNTLRRIAEGIVSIYKRKGTVPGIKDFIKLYTEFDSKVLESQNPNLRLYDGVSESYRGTLTATGMFYATDSTQTWTTDMWRHGYFSDQNSDNIYTILNNNPMTLFLDREPPAVVSDSGTIGQGISDVISTTAGNISPVTGTALSGQTGRLVDPNLAAYPDDYWNRSYCVLTSGANNARRQIVNSFDMDTATLFFDGDFPTSIAVGTSYKLERFLHVFLPSVTGYAQDSLAGRLLSVTGGTNSGQSSKIARNWEFGGGTQVVVSVPFTDVCDNTSTIEIARTGILFQDTSKTWTPDEWRGYKLTINGTDIYNIVTNDVDTLTISPVYNNQGSPDTYQFFDFVTNYPTATNSYDIENQYYVANGTHSLIFNDLIPSSYRGTLKDPGAFLFGGGARSIVTSNDLSALDLPIVLLNAVETTGRSTNLTQTVLTDLAANFTVDQYVGFKLNPNTQQLVDFEIVSNTTNSVTVTGDMTLVAEISNNYYIIDSEGSIKTKRLNDIIGEFVPHYLRPILIHEEL